MNRQPTREHYTEQFSTTKGGVQYTTMIGSPVYCIKDGSGRIIHASLYRNAGRGIAIVAVGPDAVGHWAAYLGASEDPHESEEATYLHVAECGVKLSPLEAESFLSPELVAHLGGVASYRE